MDFDFDVWKRRFETDSEEAENFRKGEIAVVIASANPQGQEVLWRLQWRIDRERERHKASPLGSYMALKEMLMENLWGGGGLAEHLHAAVGLSPQSVHMLEAYSHSPRDAVVLSFPKK